MSRPSPARPEGAAGPVAPPFARRTRDLRGSPINALTMSLAGRAGIIPLAGGTPRVADLPTDRLTALAADALAADPAVLNYGLGWGDEPARAQLRALTAATEGVTPAEEEILVTSGATQALDLACKLFLDPGDLVLVEAPTYSDALATLSAYGPRVVAVAVDGEGMRPDAIEEVVRREGRAPRMIYVVPTFQNPTGAEMSVARMRTLVEVAASHECLLIDDDPYRLLRYSGARRASLYALADGSPGVIATRSASKLIAPGLRTGWVMAKPRIIAAMTSAKGAMDICTSGLPQRVVAEFLARGELEGHLARLTARYRGYLEATVDALAREFAGTGVRWTVPAGGYFVWVTLDRGMLAEDLLPRAIEEGVSFVPGTCFAPDGAGFADSLRLCFVAADEDGLREGIRRLRAAHGAVSG